MTHGIYATLELPLGLADLRASTNVRVTFIDFKLLARLERLDNPLHAHRLEFPHAFEGPDLFDWHPVLVISRVQGPHEPVHGFNAQFWSRACC